MGNPIPIQNSQTGNPGPVISVEDIRIESVLQIELSEYPQTRDQIHYHHYYILY